MGIIYVNDGYRKAKQPVSLKQTSVDIGGGQGGLDISVEGDGNLVISSEEQQPDKVVEEEVLNIY